MCASSPPITAGDRPLTGRREGGYRPALSYDLAFRLVVGPVSAPSAAELADGMRDALMGGPVPADRLRVSVIPDRELSLVMVEGFPGSKRDAALMALALSSLAILPDGGP